MHTHAHSSRIRVFGTTKIADRGQVVLPIEARKALKLRPGDTLLAVDCCGILTLMKPKEIEMLLDKATVRLQDHISGLRKALRHHHRAK